MATANYFLDKKNKKSLDDPMPLKIKIRHNNDNRAISLNEFKKVSLSEWDSYAQKLKKPYPNIGRNNATLAEKIAIAQGICSRPSSFLKQFDTVRELRDYIVAEIDKAEMNPNHDGQHSFTPPPAKSTFLKTYALKMARHCSENKRGGTGKAYLNAVNAILTFCIEKKLPVIKIDHREHYPKHDRIKKTAKGADVLAHDLVDIRMEYIDILLLEKFQNYWLNEKKNKVGGLSSYLRSIAALMSFAEADDKEAFKEEQNPFIGKKAFVIQEEEVTERKAIDISYLRRLRMMYYAPESPKWHHRNYHLFMFNFRGMNWADFVFVQLNSFENGRLKFIRRKTRNKKKVTYFDLPVTPEAQEIIDYYSKGKSADDYLFPFVDQVDDWEDDIYVSNKLKSMKDNHNRCLQRIAEKDICVKGKLNVASLRHTFVTAGADLGLNRGRLSSVLGHGGDRIIESSI